MKRPIKIILQVIAGIVLAGGGLYIFFRKPSGGEAGIFETLVRDISDTSAVSILLCAGLAILATYLRAVRWRLMLPSAAGAQHKRGLFSIIAVSQMLNNVLPARLGEAGRVVLLWKRNKFPITTCVGSLIIERILDSMSYLLMLFMPVFLLPEIAANLRGIHPVAMMVVWAGFATFVIIAAIFPLYVFKPHWFRYIAKRVIAALPKKFGDKARTAGTDVRSCLDWTLSLRKAASVTLLTLMVALCFSSMIWILLSGSVDFVGSLFAQAFAAFGSAIPLAPGFVGTLHAAMLQGLSILGVPIGKARAAVVLYHALGYVVQTGLGLVLFATLHMKFRDITGKADNTA